MIGYTTSFVSIFFSNHHEFEELFVPPSHRGNPALDLQAPNEQCEGIY